jgi:two-component system, cell cycle response regulator DivK
LRNGSLRKGRVSARRPLVLIVERNVTTREMYAEWLAFSGCRVFEVSSAAAALAMIRVVRPDLIVTDIAPGDAFDGCALCEHIKSTTAVPVIVVTARAMGGYVERARAAGCNAVLLQPCLPETLLAEIRRQLRPRRPAPVRVRL